MEFVQQAGPQYVDQLNALLEAKRKEMKGEGLSPYSSAYSAGLQQVRFNFVDELSREHPELIRKLPPQPVSANIKLITSEEVTNLFNRDGAAALLNLIERNSADSFNLNALRDAAKLLGVKGVHTATKGLKGLDAKTAVRNLILGKKTNIQEFQNIQERQRQAYRGRYTVEQLNAMSDDELKVILAQLGLERTGTHQSLVKRILANQAPLTQTIGYTQAALESMKVDQLRNILRNLNAKSSGNKKDLVMRILTLEGQPSGGEVNASETIARIKDIVDEEGTIAARRYAEEIAPDVYESATVSELQELVRLLAIKPQKAGSTPVKKELIKAITGKSSSLQASRERREAIQADLSLCEQSSEEELDIAARELGINTRGLSKLQICQEIHRAYLYRFSSLILSQLAPGGKTTLANLASMTADERKKAIQALARSAKYAPVSTLPDLMREFLVSHYKARALQYAPDALEVINEYLMDGVVPQRQRDLDELARVFNDINPELFTLEDTRALSAALDELYISFIRVVMRGEEGSTQALMDRFSHFGYSPARRNAGVLSRPRVAPQPVIQYPEERAGEQAFEEEEEGEELSL